MLLSLPLLLLLLLLGLMRQLLRVLLLLRRSWLYLRLVRVLEHLTVSRLGWL